MVKPDRDSIRTLVWIRSKPDDGVLTRRPHIEGYAGRSPTRNPQSQRRAVAAIQFPTGTGSPVNGHRDDPKYAIASEVLDNVRVQVSGQYQAGVTTDRRHFLR